MLPQDEMRRREARLAQRESRLASRERDVAAREAELACEEDDRHLRALLVGARAAVRRRRIQVAAVRLVPAILGLWLMGHPLAVGEPRGVAMAAVGGGAALAFVALAMAHTTFRERWAPWALGAVATWVVAWAALGRVAPVAAWSLAATGCAVWIAALAAATTPSGY